MCILPVVYVSFFFFLLGRWKVFSNFDLLEFIIILKRKKMRNIKDNELIFTSGKIFHMHPAIHNIFHIG